MIKLSTEIPKEYIKKSKKLSNFDTELCWNEDLSTKFPVKRKEYGADHWIKAKNYGYFTIADIIDNAEELFGDEERCDKCRKTRVDEKEDVCSRCGINYFKKTYKSMQLEIIKGLQQNKSIEEISQYILDNIKEE